MFLRIAPALSSVLLLAGAGASWLPSESAGAPSTIAVDGDELHELMEGLQSGMRSLRKQITPENAETAIATIREMQGRVLASIGHVPPVADDVDEAGKLTWGTGYKRRMMKLGIALVDLEELLLQGKIDEAKASYRKLNEHKKEGHDKYYPG